MVSALVDLHVGHVHVETLQQLAQHLALGLDELCMKFTFHVLEVFAHQRARSKCADSLAQSFERARASFVAAGTMGWCMKYWHWGSPP